MITVLYAPKLGTKKPAWERCPANHYPVHLPRPDAWVAVPMAYYDEAVHQDGDEYWLRFDTVQELAVDIQLYLGG